MDKNKRTEEVEKMVECINKFYNVTDDITIYCRPWVYKYLNELAEEVCEHVKVEIIPTDMIPENHIAVIIDNNYRRT